MNDIGLNLNEMEKLVYYYQLAFDKISEANSLYGEANKEISSSMSAGEFEKSGRPRLDMFISKLGSYAATVEITAAYIAHANKEFINMDNVLAQKTADTILNEPSMSDEQRKQLLENKESVAAWVKKLNAETDPEKRKSIGFELVGGDLAKARSQAQASAPSKPASMQENQNETKQFMNDEKNPNSEESTEPAVQENESFEAKEVSQQSSGKAEMTHQINNETNFENQKESTQKVEVKRNELNLGNAREMNSHESDTKNTDIEAKEEKHPLHENKETKHNEFSRINEIAAKITGSKKFNQSPAEFSDVVKGYSIESQNKGGI
jgi:hypothetical protein